MRDWGEEFDDFSPHVQADRDVHFKLLPETPPNVAIAIATKIAKIAVLQIQNIVEHIDPEVSLNWFSMAEMALFEILERSQKDLVLKGRQQYAQANHAKVLFEQFGIVGESIHHWVLRTVTTIVKFFGDPERDCGFDWTAWSGWSSTLLIPELEMESKYIRDVLVQEKEGKKSDRRKAPTSLKAANSATQPADQHFRALDNAGARLKDLRTLLQQVFEEAFPDLRDALEMQELSPDFVSAFEEGYRRVAGEISVDTFVSWATWLGLAERFGTYPDHQVTPKFARRLGKAIRNHPTQLYTYPKTATLFGALGIFEFRPHQYRGWNCRLKPDQPPERVLETITEIARRGLLFIDRWIIEGSVAVPPQWHGFAHLAMEAGLTCEPVQLAVMDARVQAARIADEAALIARHGITSSSWHNWTSTAFRTFGLGHAGIEADDFQCTEEEKNQTIQKWTWDGTDAMVPDAYFDSDFIIPLLRVESALARDILRNSTKASLATATRSKSCGDNAPDSRESLNYLGIVLNEEKRTISRIGTKMPPIGLSAQQWRLCKAFYKNESRGVSKVELELLLSDADDDARRTAISDLRSLLRDSLGLTITDGRGNRNRTLVNAQREQDLTMT